MLLEQARTLQLSSPCTMRMTAGVTSRNGGVQHACGGSQTRLRGMHAEDPLPAWLT